MDVAYINPFVTATIDMFKTMLNVEVKPGNPELKEGHTRTYDISGIIGLSGEAQGSIALSFPKRGALKVVSALIGVEIKTIDSDITDGIGELVNIIAGNAKRGLSQFNLTISLPNIVIGREHTVAIPKGTPAIVVPFEGPLTDFAMEVALKTR